MDWYSKLCNLAHTPESLDHENIAEDKLFSLLRLDTQIKHTWTFSKAGVKKAPAVEPTRRRDVSTEAEDQLLSLRHADLSRPLRQVVVAQHPQPRQLPAEVSAG